MTYRFTCITPGVHTFSAADGDVTATLTRTHAATYRDAAYPASAWSWEVRVCGEVVDQGALGSGGMAPARQAASLVLDAIMPHFAHYGVTA